MCGLSGHHVFDAPGASASLQLGLYLELHDERPVGR
jgi:hypothetical protein